MEAIDLESPDLPANNGVCVSDARSAQLNDDLDDIFGSEPSSPTTAAHTRGYTECSDIPRLQEKHEKEGYRDGVTAGKSKTVQAGFDEGYSLGAVLGLRIGKLLGLLEGIASALLKADEDSGLAREKDRVHALLSDAREELNARRVFAKHWWNDDGTWKYPVVGDQEGAEIVFADVASAHPLVRKWEAVLDTELAMWHVDLAVLDDGDEHRVVESVLAAQKIKSPVEAPLAASIKTKENLRW